jgi:hypothetical protein
MAGSLSVATTAVSSAKLAVVVSGEAGQSAVYSRYNGNQSRFIFEDFGLLLPIVMSQLPHPPLYHNGLLYFN